MQLNMLVLQQNLKNIEPETATLTRSAKYFELFIAGPDAIVAKAKEDATATAGNGVGAAASKGDDDDDEKGREDEGGQAAAAARGGHENEERGGRAVVGGGGGGGGGARGEGEGNVKFSHDELKFLIELCYSESLSSERRDAAVQANRALNEHLLLLSEQTWQQQQQQQQAQQAQQQQAQPQQAQQK